MCYIFPLGIDSEYWWGRVNCGIVWGPTGFWERLRVGFFPYLFLDHWEVPLMGVLLGKFMFLFLSYSLDILPRLSGLCVLLWGCISLMLLRLISIYLSGWGYTKSLVDVMPVYTFVTVELGLGILDSFPWFSWHVCWCRNHPCNCIRNHVVSEWVNQVLGIVCCSFDHLVADL